MFFLRWLEYKRTQRFNKEFARGFGWVMYEYYYRREFLGYLKNMVALGSIDRIAPGFDEGCKAAFDVIEERMS